eukprot:7769998-Pyramimonas_sp.AAC.1
MERTYGAKRARARLDSKKLEMRPDPITGSTGGHGRVLPDEGLRDRGPGRQGEAGHADLGRE